MSAPKRKKNPKPGQRVVLKSLPKGFIDDLPLEDKRAISEVVGRPILLKAYEEDGRAELEFTDRNDVIHILYVDPSFIETFVH
jgi:hypothetical protein